MQHHFPDHVVVVRCQRNKQGASVVVRKKADKKKDRMDQEWIRKGHVKVHFRVKTAKNRQAREKERRDIRVYRRKAGHESKAKTFERVRERERDEQIECKQELKKVRRSSCIRGKYCEKEHEAPREKSAGQQREKRRGQEMNRGTRQRTRCRLVLQDSLSVCEESEHRHLQLLFARLHDGTSAWHQSRRWDWMGEWHERCGCSFRQQRERERARLPG